ncbi:MAG TPA: acetylxylan esterase [Planctomycetota bacterium]|jgi:dienelactone hydrolase|nr:acetylxylan esterase [Planctomycetota bacterium]
MRTIAVLLLLARAAAAQSSWDLEALSKAPKTAAVEGFEVDGLKAIYYDGLPWKGKPTRVFAWVGIPKVEGKVPAMVLVHGGGGTAFSDWAKLWTGRGYAAIAMDLCGALPRKAGKGWERHEQGGPPGWGGFDQIDGAENDHWTHHAVADVILAHSLLRSFPEVDPERIGITGISWGGYLTCISASVDARFKFAAPVYGCGFLGENSVWLDTFAKMGKEKAELWLKLWDPSQYLRQAKMPFLWVNGTNDFAYPLDSYQKSYRLPATGRTLAIRVRMAHAHGGPGEKPEEIHAYANALFNGGVPLATVTGQGVEKGEAWATFTSKAPVVKAELSYTRDAGKWQPRKWESAEAKLQGGRASAPIPDGARVFYLNLFDDRGLVVSSEHVEQP